MAAINFAQRVAKKIGEDVHAQDSLERYRIEHNLTVGAIVSYFINKFSKDKIWEQKISTFQRFAQKEGNVLIVDKKLAIFIEENKLTDQQIEAYINSQIAYRLYEYSPIGVLSELMGIGATLKMRDEDDDGKEGDFVEMKLRGETFLIAMHEGYPTCDAKFRDFLKRVLNNEKIQLYPLDMVVLKFLMFFLGVAKIDRVKGQPRKQVVMRNTKAMNLLVGSHSKSFGPQGWSDIIRTVISEASSPASCPKIEEVLNCSVPATSDNLYKIFYRLIATNKANRDYFVNFLKENALIDMKGPNVMRNYYKSKGLYGAMNYVSSRRSMYGEDKSLGSDLTRNSHIGNGMPSAWSTAYKWLEVLQKMPNEKFPRIVVAGNKPGHWMPLVKSVLKDRMTVEKFSGDDSVEVEGQTVANVQFIDIVKCNRTDDHTWDVADVRAIVPTKGMMIISDCYPDNATDYEQLNDSTKYLVAYMMGRRFRSVSDPRTVSCPPLQHFAWKINLALDDKIKIKNSTRNMVPRPLSAMIRILGKAKNPVYPYITKIGRSHNTECVITSYKVNENSVHMDSEDALIGFINKVTDAMVDENFKRMWYMLSRAQMKPVVADTLKHSENPILYVGKEVFDVPEEMGIAKDLEFTLGDLTANFGEMGMIDHQAMIEHVAAAEKKMAVKVAPKPTTVISAPKNNTNLAPIDDDEDGFDDELMQDFGSSKFDPDN